MTTPNTDQNNPTVFDLVVPTPRKPRGQLLYSPQLVDTDHLLYVGRDKPYDRGYQQNDQILRLDEYDEKGVLTGHFECIYAPADGFVSGLPDQPCYVEPGDIIGQLNEGYVYRRNRFQEDRTRFQKWKQLHFYKRPRIQYSLHFFMQD